MNAKPTKRKNAPAEYLKFRVRWRHVLRIDELIRAGQAPNCRSLADEMEVSRRTILRDIDFLRYDLGAPVEYDPARGGYVYTQPHWIMPSVRITEGELFALLVAEKALEAYAGTPWAESLRKVFDRMAMNLPERVEIAPRDLLPRVEFDPEAPASVDPAVLATVAKAVAANQVLRVTYRPLGQDNPRQYVLDPYLVRRARGAWYLVGRDHRSGHVPIFNLTRMQKVEPTGETFDYAASGFDPARYFAATFGAYEAPGRHRVRLEFRGTGAELVRERRWQPSQKLTDRPGGKVRLELEVSHLDDVWPWVLSWGSMAKVLAPKELADLVAEQAAGTLRNYRAGRHS